MPRAAACGEVAPLSASGRRSSWAAAAAARTATRCPTGCSSPLPCECPGSASGNSNSCSTILQTGAKHERQKLLHYALGFSSVVEDRSLLCRPCSAPVIQIAVQLYLPDSDSLMTTMEGDFGLDSGQVQDFCPCFFPAPAHRTNTVFTRVKVSLKYLTHPNICPLKCLDTHSTLHPKVVCLTHSRVFRR